MAWAKVSYDPGEITPVCMRETLSDALGIGVKPCSSTLRGMLTKPATARRGNASTVCMAVYGIYHRAALNTGERRGPAKSFASSIYNDIFIARRKRRKHRISGE